MNMITNITLDDPKITKRTTRIWEKAFGIIDQIPAADLNIRTGYRRADWPNQPGCTGWWTDRGPTGGPRRSDRGTDSAADRGADKGGRPPITQFGQIWPKKINKLIHKLMPRQINQSFLKLDAKGNKPIPVEMPNQPECPGWLVPIADGSTWATHINLLKQKSATWHHVHVSLERAKVRCRCLDTLVLAWWRWRFRVEVINARAVPKVWDATWICAENGSWCSPTSTTSPVTMDTFWQNWKGGWMSSNYKNTSQ